ncbi:MAG: archease [Methanobacteriaceae archaeon]|nr:archease [Candidatus Methanorudis spinitermitis]
MNKKNQEIQEKIHQKYEFFDVTADIGFWAYGKTLEESFENAALAMFNVITKTDSVAENESRKINIESEDLTSLLYDFLEELLFIYEVDLLLFSKFDLSIKKGNIDNNEIYKLEAVVTGEEIDWNKHYRGSEVKAITFHMMEVLCEDICKIRVILDL